MNDRRFTELLNLYVDHEIAPAEAAELEAEVLHNPVRRRVYDRYCRMQRACSLLGAHERAQAPASQAFARSLREAERKIANPRGAVPFWRTAYFGTFTGAAMAACVVVIVVVNRQQPSASSPSSPTANAEVVAINQSQPVVADKPVAATSVAAVTVVTPAVAVAPVPTATGSSAFEFQPVLVAASMSSARNPREVEVASNDREALEWMKRVDALQLKQVIVDEQAFEARSTLQPDNRVFRGRHSLQGSAEFTAFQFQR